MATACRHSCHCSVLNRLLPPRFATSRSPKRSRRSASTTGVKAGPGVRRVPKGRARLAIRTAIERMTSATPATRSIENIRRGFYTHAGGTGPPPAAGDPMRRPARVAVLLDLLAALLLAALLTTLTLALVLTTRMLATLVRAALLLAALLATLLLARFELNGFRAVLVAAVAVELNGLRAVLVAALAVHLVALVLIFAEFLFSHVSGSFRSSSAQIKCNGHTSACICRSFSNCSDTQLRPRVEASERPCGRLADDGIGISGIRAKERLRRGGVCALREDERGIPEQTGTPGAPDRRAAKALAKGFLVEAEDVRHVGDWARSREGGLTRGRSLAVPRADLLADVAAE